MRWGWGGSEIFLPKIVPSADISSSINAVMSRRVWLLVGTRESKPENPLKVSQSTLAEMVGTTRARVSKFMGGFRKKGLVSYNGGLQINSGLIISFLQNRPMSVKKQT
jgi:CRP-like cAMP-binding protein